jgi:hypothetical protein
VPAGDVHATRRGGARHEVSARVSLVCESGKILEGWALNVSRGGVRVILEEKVEPGARFEVRLTGVAGAQSTDPKVEPRTGRVIWVQEEPDGVVAGLEFRLEADTTPKS